MQHLDTTVSLGNIITITVIIFTIGGAWATIRGGIREIRDQGRRDKDQTHDKLGEIAKDIAEIRREYVTEKSNQKTFEYIDRRLDSIDDQLKRHPR